MNFSHSLMKSIHVLSIVYYIWMSKCTSYDTTLERNNTPNDTLHFSFDKTNFTNFECNFTNDILTHSSLYKPPFYIINESISNLIYTFCYFVLYSETKNNNQFKKKLKKLFKSQLKTNHRLDNEKSGFKYDSEIFEKQIEILETTILNILEEKDENKMFVTAEEKEGRIIITHKESTNECYYKITPNVKESKELINSNEELDKAFVTFHNKFNEMYLQKLLGESYTVSYDEVTSSSRQDINTLYDELRKSFYRIILLIKIRDTETSDDRRNLKNEIEVARLKAKDETFYAVTRLFELESVPMYFRKLIQKSTVKSLIGLWNKTVENDIFTLYPTEHREGMYAILSIFKKFLQTPNKISYTKEKLSEESILNLVKHCLELTI